jgi:heme-degrading monooxygenase HmoA
MFSVLFEVHPKTEQWDNYLGNAKMLRPELEQIEGFVDNIRYGSLKRTGWILSLSSWEDEKALVRWRTHQKHHETQAKGRDEILSDYHLRVGQYTKDTKLPSDRKLIEQRFDETTVGEGTTAVLITAKQSEGWIKSTKADDIAKYLGLISNHPGLESWDVYDAVLAPGELILMTVWKTQLEARTFEDTVTLPKDGRLRRVRIVRDYSMFDRREAPQYYPDAKGQKTVHS